MEKLRCGDVDDAIESARATRTEIFTSGAAIWDAFATSVLVEALLQRRGHADLTDAREARDQLAAAPTDPGIVLHEVVVLRLRALLAKAHDEETSYRDFRDRYRTLAKSLNFTGQMQWTEAMP